MVEPQTVDLLRVVSDVTTAPRGAVLRSKFSAARVSLAGAGSTNPEAPVRDNEYYKRAFDLSF